MTGSPVRQPGCHGGSRLVEPRQEMMAEGPQMTQMRSLRSNRSEQVRLFPTFGWSSFLEKPEISEGKRVTNLLEKNSY